MITDKGLYKLPMKVKGYKGGQPSVSIAMPFRARQAAAKAGWPDRGTVLRLDGRRLAPHRKGSLSGESGVPALTPLGALPADE
jgi:hypothetical protein